MSGSPDNGDEAVLADGRAGSDPCPTGRPGSWPTRIQTH